METGQSFDWWQEQDAGFVEMAIDLVVQRNRRQGDG